ncbi:universal stress protein [Aureibacter tunicatorum]|uniref:Nucleotide-binding universal stress UspA family protein n=1 Tax=Aureibacter tunicatorum TaxID=866807 RepID=A0AAE3XJZ1_9BACT|nr:universal stress protein [Aureibacter tunicatorum]MDR6237368.1 nucleotide-binding universal stress UspA family protein [Aureibacter tunicatorum]BDD06359.1 hypothetical protein AUTU_38420 [Aureibacter tunicatorum]
MYDIKKVMVALDLSYHDQFLIKYLLKNLEHNDNLEEVYLIHVVKDYNDPVLKERFSGDQPIDEQIKTYIKSEISSCGGEDFMPRINIEIHEGQVANTIIKWVDLKKVDLVVLGKKYDVQHTEEVPKHVVRLAKCSVLVLPDKELPNEVEKFVVGVDFSDLSVQVVQQAHLIANTVMSFFGKKPSVQLINVFEVPIGYHSTGKSFEEFSDIIKKNHQKEFDQFVKKHHLEGYNLRCDFLLDEEGDTAKRIARYVADTHAIGFLIGSKGRTNLASMLLGSVAEDLLKYKHEVPFGVIKDKSSNFDFFDAIMNV